MNSNSTSTPIRVGIVGLGRSGWNIHAKTLLPMKERYVVTAVTDPSSERRLEATTACGARAHESLDGLLGDREVDLVVIASPNHLHVEHTIAALQRGKHVVCEKPFALNTADADRAIEAARRADRIVAPFHNRRYEAHFQQVRKIIASGVLGEIIQVRMAWHSFGRRWDWQTLREFGGGSLNNNGSHLLDHALQIFGDGEPQVFADIRHTSLSAGDADDHIKVILHSPGRTTVDCELTSAAAYQQDRWHIMGTSGGLRGTTEALEWKFVDWTQLPQRIADRAHAPGRAYNSEKIPWQEQSWSAPVDGPRVADLFYEDLFRTLRQGQPLAVTPESIRRLIAVMDICRRSMAQ